jgi:hypothetical protein
VLNRGGVAIAAADPATALVAVAPIAEWARRGDDAGGAPAAAARREWYARIVTHELAHLAYEAAPGAWGRATAWAPRSEAAARCVAARTADTAAAPAYGASGLPGAGELARCGGAPAPRSLAARL